MRKLFSIICLSILVTTIHAQSSNKFTGALLWKISGKNIKEPSYIFGSHHMTNISFLDSIPGIKYAQAVTQQVVGEILISEQMEIQQKVQNIAMLSPEEAYDKLLSSDEYEELNNNLTQILGIGLAQLGNLKPGFINIILASKLQVLSDPNFNPEQHEAIDVYFQNLAKEEGKDVFGLESIDTQLELMFEIGTQKEQAKNLLCMLSSIDYQKQTLLKLNKLYREGNIAGLYDLTIRNAEDPCPQTETEIEAMLKNRNDKWLEQLPKIMDNNPTLIVVGALHLAGEEGLLFQLDKAGYKVEAIK